MVERNIELEKHKSPKEWKILIKDISWILLTDQLIDHNLNYKWKFRKNRKAFGEYNW